MFSYTIKYMIQNKKGEQMNNADPIEIISYKSILYPIVLKMLCKTTNGAVLLNQIIYWDRIKKGKFYKFKMPCNNKLYKLGDSWVEELCFSKYEFNTALKNIAVKKTRANAESNEVKKAFVWYHTDLNRLTWYELNRKVLRKALNETYVKIADLRRLGLSTYVGSENQPRLYTENTKQRLHTEKVLSKDKTPKKVLAREQEKGSFDTRDNNDIDHDQEHTLNNNDIDHDQEQNYLNIFNYSLKTKTILKYWNKLGGKIHKRKNAKTPDMIENMIQELLHQGRNPFASVQTKETHCIITKKFSVKEIKQCIKYYAQELNKPIEKLYFNEFVVFRKNGKLSMRDNSPLAETFILLPKNIKTSKRIKFLQEQLTPLRPKEKISNIIFINASNFLKKLENNYRVHEGAAVTYYGRIPRVFVDYVKEKCNQLDFKLSYISGDAFHHQFLQDSLKHYQLQLLTYEDWIKKGRIPNEFN